MIDKRLWKQIDLLLDNDFIFCYFNKRIKKIDGKAISLSNINLHSIKNHRGKRNRHVVVFYLLTYATKNSREQKIKIVASAHSNGARRLTYKIMRTIYQHGFNTKKYAIPRPLFYDRLHKAIFYKATLGNNLYFFIKNKKWKIVKSCSLKLALWLAKLHKLKIKNISLKHNQLTRQSIDPENLLNKGNAASMRFKKNIVLLFNQIKKRENKIISGPGNQTLHGDIHPENVIVNPNKKHITIIDFTECKKGHYTYDIASFCQQLEVMSKGYFSKKEVRQLQKLFLKTYFKKRKIKPTQKTFNEINLYMAWVALRGAIYFINSNKAYKVEEFIKESNYYLHSIKL